MSSSYHTYGVGGGSAYFGDAVANVAALPLVGSITGEIRLVLDTDVLYEWNGSAWVAIHSGPLVPGNLTESTSSVLTISNGTGATAGPATTIQVKQAATGQSGFLSNTDWNTFNNKQPALGFTPENAANKNVANGYAPLDALSKVPIANLPSAIMEYKGAWNANTNTPTLIDGTGDSGDVYRVSVAGTRSLGSGSISWIVGEFAVYNGTIWEQSPASDGVISVNGAQGAVSLDIDDLTDVTITTPAADDMLFWTGSAWVNRQKYTSAGCFTIPSYTNNGGGNITVNTVDVALWKDAVFTGQSQKYTLAPITVTLTDNTFNYVVGDYNAGSPILKVITDVTLITESDVIPVYSIYRFGAELHVQPWDTLGRGLPNKVHQSIVKTQRYRRQSGLELSEYGTRNVKVAEGIVWMGGNKVDITEVLSVSDNITFYYHVASAWTSSSVTQYNNTQYDDGTALQSVGVGRYAINWIYRAIDMDDHIFMVLGTDNYKLSEAQNAQPPASLPAEISSVCMLVGRIIVLASAATATNVDSAFAITFTGTTGNHNDLSGLQGGTTDEYYHLTSAQHTVATQAATTSLNGYLSAVNWNSFNQRQEYHGMENRTSSTLVWTDSGPDRTLTLTGTFNYYYQGTKVTVSSSPAAQIDNTPGLWWIYFNTAGVLTANVNAPSFKTNVHVANVFWNGTTGAVSDERHGHKRNIDWHEWAHDTVGMRYESGLDITNAGTGASATFSLSTGKLHDEDLEHEGLAPATTCRNWYQTGATTFTFVTTASTTPFIWNGGTSRVRYVNAAAPYALADVDAAKYVNVWVYGSADISVIPYMFAETIATATGGYTTASNARAAMPPSLSGLGLSPEIKLLYRLVVKGDGVVQTALTSDDYRNASVLPAGGTASSTASSISFVPTGDIASATVQSAIAELDSEKQPLITIESKSADFTAAANKIYLVDCSGAPIAVQLPTPVLGLWFEVKDAKFASLANNITLVRAGAEKIDEVAGTYTLNSDGIAVKVVSDGTDWWVL